MTKSKASNITLNKGKLRVDREVETTFHTLKHALMTTLAFLILTRTLLLSVLPLEEASM